MQHQQEWIIKVHGTFAAEDEDTGEAWWQWGSSFSEALQQHLPDTMAFMPADKTFHWSGVNSEREREQAARDLLELLEGIEAPFHVIAHSHGGSVLWRALQLSLLKTIAKAPGSAARAGLTNLKSWTTIGTPFLQIEPEPITVNLFTLLFRFAAVLAYLLFFAATGYILYALLSLIPALTWTYSTGWLIAAFAVLPVALLLMLFGLKNTAGFLEAMMLEVSKPLHNWTSRVYAKRWLPLWAEADEALLAIRAAKHLKGSFAPRMRPMPVVFGSDVVLRWLRWPAEKLWAPFYNRFLAPRGDRAFLSILQKFSSGNDLPGTFVGSVTPGPSPLLAQPPPLATAVQKELEHNADQALLKVMPQVRPLLGGLATGHLVLNQEANGSAGSVLSGEEMVHTTYYRNAQVIALIGAYLSSVAAGSTGSATDSWLMQTEAWKNKQMQSIKQDTEDPGTWTFFHWMYRVLSDGQIVKGFYSTMPVPGLLALVKVALKMADLYQKRQFNKEHESA